jgi:hypothetical protein
VEKMTRKELMKLVQQVQAERSHFEQQNEANIEKVRELSSQNATLRGLSDAANAARENAQRAYHEMELRKNNLVKLVKVAANLISIDSIHGDDYS